MVCEKNKEANKSKFFTVALVLIVVGFMVFVLATTTMNSPVADGNYSGTLNISITVDGNGANNMTNITCYYNISGGAATTWFVEILNSSVDATVFENASIDISDIGDGLSTYNISCGVYNGTYLNLTLSYGNITFDSTAPNVSTFYNTVNNGNYPGTIVINVSVVDATIGIDSVYFNITNSTGDQHNFTKASNPDNGDYYNITVNTTKFTDGVYNITVWANDTHLNNLNNSERISVTFDDTAPVPSSLTKSSSTTTSLKITFSGADGTCTATGTGTKVISGSTLTVTGLSCGNSYAYTITCVDAAGNSGDSSETSFSTSSCGGGSGTPSFWTGTTHVVNEEQFRQGFTKQMKVKERMKVKVGTAYHHVGVKELTTTSATIEIASDPVEVKLDVGEDAKVDVDADDIYDIYVILNSIADNKADVTVKSISEEIPEGEGAVSITGEDATTTDDGEVVDTTGDEEEKSLVWLWILIVVIVLVVIGFIIYKNKKAN